MSVLADIVEQKNQWLISQVDVPYPTEESVKVRDLYLNACGNSVCQIFEPSPLAQSTAYYDEIYLVDFHRLTVMFAQLQANQWQEAGHQVSILEFFAQIIISEQQPLYIGFKAGEPAACGLVTYLNDQLLISDVVAADGDPVHCELFVSQLIGQLAVDEQAMKVMVQQWASLSGCD
jgi:hypothetical protein